MSEAVGNGEGGRIVVNVDPDLEDLVPTFLENRHKDVRTLTASLESGDMATVQRLGHSMKGAGGGYGFDGISEIGAGLEQAGKAGDQEGIRAGIAALESYLQRVEVVYE